MLTPLAVSSRGAVQRGVQCDLWWWWRDSKAINLLVDLHSYSNKSVALGSDWKSNFVDISGGSELPPKGLSFKDRMRSHLGGAQYWAAIVPLHIKGHGRGGLDIWLRYLQAPSTGIAYQERMWRSQDELESLHLLVSPFYTAFQSLRRWLWRGKSRVLILQHRNIVMK